MLFFRNDYGQGCIPEIMEYMNTTNGHSFTGYGMDAICQNAKETIKWDPEETELVSVKEQEIKYEDFDKVELKVAEVIDCQKVKGADKLLQFRLAAGDNQDRQILSGVAEFYPDPSQLIGKKVVIVANLKPRKMRGLISQGMILSAESKEGKLKLVEAPNGMPNGSVIA